jgi:thiamine-monophosphate kinase
VTGSLGASGRGKHLSFEPRVREALKMTGLVTLNAMMDLSDGLSSDLNRICHQSSVGALIDAASIPVSQDAKLEDDPLGAAINDGEDFELLFTLGAQPWDRLRRAWDDPMPITKIGTIVDTGRMQIRMPDGQIKDLEPHGYEHLKRQA